jgi:hypothetical protein
MDRWNWSYVIVTAAVFGFWQNNIVAGVFMLLLLVGLVTLFHGTIDGLIGVGRCIQRIEKLLQERLEDPTGGCTGYKDCPCWWHTEQRALAERK